MKNEKIRDKRAERLSQKLTVYQNFKLVFLEILFLFRFAVIAKKTKVQIGLKIFLLLQNMFLYGLNLRIKL